MYSINEISFRIIGCAMKVHTRLGPGLLESAYEACLAHELGRDGLEYERQCVLPMQYDEIFVEAGYRVDLLVERSVIVELKAVEAIAPVHKAQVITYLRLSGY
jgi:GxxExxY protein